LLKRLGVNLLLRFARPGLQFGIDGELHDGGAPPPGKPPNFISRLGGGVKAKHDTTCRKRDRDAKIIFLRVIPGRRAAASPESITTVSEYGFRTCRQCGNPE
jgi:hypothetical protein